MQSSAIVSSSNNSARASYFSRICSVLTPVHRFSLSQDGEIISRGSIRYCFVAFCEPQELCSLLGASVSVGRCIGYIRDSGTYYIRSVNGDSEGHIVLNGPGGCEIFRKIR